MSLSEPFDGIGGCSIGGGGTCEYNQAKALLVDDGWQVDYASSWRSLDPYRMMTMLAPNINGSGQLTNDEISDISRPSNGLRSGSSQQKTHSVMHLQFRP